MWWSVAYVNALVCPQAMASYFYLVSKSQHFSIVAFLPLLWCSTYKYKVKIAWNSSWEESIIITKIGHVYVKYQHKMLLMTDHMDSTCECIRKKRSIASLLRLVVWDTSNVWVKAFANVAVAFRVLSYSRNWTRPQEIHGFSPWISYWLSAQFLNSQGSNLF